MSAVSWAALEAFSSPASTSSASSGDDWWRSFLSSFALGISTSYIWPGSGSGSSASAGVSQWGTARCAVASNSAVTGGYGDGFLLLNQNHLSLHHIGSTWTDLLGHSAMVDHNATGRWLTQEGVISLNSATAGSFGTILTSFLSPFRTNPVHVQFSLDTTLGYVVNISSLTTGGFLSVYSGLRGAIALTTVAWEAEGPI